MICVLCEKTYDEDLWRLHNGDGVNQTVCEACAVEWINRPPPRPPTTFSCRSAFIPVFEGEADAPR